jgi:hypothetical protein
MFHGTASEIKTLNNTMMFLTHDIDAAKAYGDVVHVIELAADANIGDESDLREIVESLDYDWSEERPWGWLDYKKVRAAAIEAGFDGFQGDDCLPGTDGSSRDDQHDFTAVFNPAVSCRIVGLA